MNISLADAAANLSAPGPHGFAANPVFTHSWAQISGDYAPSLTRIGQKTVLGSPSALVNPTRIIFAAGFSGGINDSINFKGIINANLSGLSILS
jgi:hypothetical protein